MHHSSRLVATMGMAVTCLGYGVWAIAPVEVCRLLLGVGNWSEDHKTSASTRRA
jgi:hypothetical protein